MFKFALMLYLLVTTILGLVMFIAMVREEVELSGEVSRGDALQVFGICICPLLNLVGFFVYVRESKNLKRFFDKSFLTKKVAK